MNPAKNNDPVHCAVVMSAPHQKKSALMLVLLLAARLTLLRQWRYTSTSITAIQVNTARWQYCSPSERARHISGVWSGTGQHGHTTARSVHITNGHVTNGQITNGHVTRSHHGTVTCKQSHRGIVPSQMVTSQTINTNMIFHLFCFVRKEVSNRFIIAYGPTMISIQFFFGGGISTDINHLIEVRNMPRCSDTAELKLN